MGSEDTGFEKLHEAQVLYEQYLELAAVGERAILDRLAAAASERARTEFITHHSVSSLYRSSPQP
ncbi:MAG: hypothetical protein OXD37_05725 [Acidimicrobiaceae bacterium]|nr:hypothetical protein [Acidimicrobiaceae bacterium]